MKLAKKIFLLSLFSASITSAAPNPNCIEDSDKNAPYLFYFQPNSDGKTCSMKRWDSRDGSKMDILKLDFCPDQDHVPMDGVKNLTFVKDKVIQLKLTSQRTYELQELPLPKYPDLPSQTGWGLGVFNGSAAAYFTVGPRDNCDVYYMRWDRNSKTWEKIEDLSYIHYDPETGLGYKPAKGSIRCRYGDFGNRVHAYGFDELVPMEQYDWRLLRDLLPPTLGPGFRNRFVALSESPITEVE